MSCIPDCGQDVNHVASLECGVTGWQCPAGMVRWECCPADSCAFRDYMCCNRYTGHQELPICGADGLLKGCAADSTPSDDVCIPEGLDVTNDCEVLDERACSMLGQRCSTRPWYCECGTRETGSGRALAWARGGERDAGEGWRAGADGKRRPWCAEMRASGSVLVRTTRTSARPA